MRKKHKRDYEKPELIKINLDAKTAVLGACKIDAGMGKGGFGCFGIEYGGYCAEPTS